MSVYLGTNLLAGTPDITGKANTSLNNLDSTGQAVINGKVDLNLDNMNPSATAKETMVGWGIPDYSAGISLNGISSPYTAPKDGVVILERNIGTVYVNGNYAASSNQTYSSYSVFIPVSSGDIVSWTQGTPYSGVFYPLKGVN